MQRYPFPNYHEEAKVGQHHQNLELTSWNNTSNKMTKGIITDEMLMLDPLSVIDPFDAVDADDDDDDDDPHDMSKIMTEPVVSDDFDTAMLFGSTATTTCSSSTTVLEPILPISREEFLSLQALPPETTSATIEPPQPKRVSLACSTTSPSSSSGGSGRVGNRASWKETPLHENYSLGSWDVLLGRGKDAFNNIGNRRLRLLVATNLEDYINGSRHEKTQVIRDIVSQVQQAHGKFVKRSSQDDGWVEIDTNQARDKVGHIFRDSLRQQKQKRNTKKKQQQQKKNTTSSAGSSSSDTKKTNKKKSTIATTTSKTSSNSSNNEKMKATKTTTAAIVDAAVATISNEFPTTTTNNQGDYHHLHASQNSIFRGMNLYYPQPRTGQRGGFFPDKTVSSSSSPPSLVNLLVPM